ncbi:hypothetical protein [Phytohabitans rumicis]|uniref:Uncharacterized protein n=1 Tax=Phytohabitans rumicis TaxID=1076125 RepID=A0A6V8LEH1_9ACTN|nr:hypothetical protein [Phytohabitans rumicis]GFJ92486.1 hypothetical protein Prum_061280 [Phytohabitans rumicis]
MQRPLFQSQTTAVLVGAALFLAGSYCLWDAWGGRGQSTPRLARPFTWW